MLRHDVVQIMAARIDWRRLADIAPAVAASTRIRHLVPAAERAGAAPREVPRCRHCIASADPAVRAERVEQFLKEHVARLLGAAQTAIDPERPIVELGLDSLIAAELTVVIERDLKVEIATTRMLGGMSVRGLAGEILAHPASRRRGAAGCSRALLPLAADPCPDPVAAPEPVPPPVASSNGHHERITPASTTKTGPPRNRRFVLPSPAGFHLLGRIETEGFENIPTARPLPARGESSQHGRRPAASDAVAAPRHHPGE